MLYCSLTVCKAGLARLLQELEDVFRQRNCISTPYVFLPRRGNEFRPTPYVKHNINGIITNNSMNIPEGI